MRHRSRPRGRLASLLPVVAAAVIGVSACSETYAVLTVEDPDGLAADATALRIGESPDAMNEIPLDGSEFPLTQTQSSTTAGDRLVWVEAVSGEGAALGRDVVTLRFEQGETTTARATLKAPCDDDAACDDGVFCNGAERCEDRVCVTGQVPCPPSVIACVEQGCDEAAGACTTLVDHDVCADGEYCNPAAGCLAGQPCTADGTEDPACDDGFTCNGAERCEGYRCVAGIPPAADDDNVCTIDACAEPGGVLHSDAPDGNACALAGGGAGICLQGTCVSTGCGDGFVDVSAGEECDDGAANDDTTPNACRTGCALPSCGDGVRDQDEECDDANADDTDACVAGCKTSSCGDGFVRAGDEQCDEGVLNSDVNVDACRTDCLNPTCGDAVVDTGEACDDGDAEDDDACLTTCEDNVCGDGYVHLGVEECDDTNVDETDACLSSCEDNVCGDGHVYVGVEACDDGNGVVTDDCLPGCFAARCGDGVINVGAEECDDANTTPRDGCSEVCNYTRWQVDLQGALSPDAALVSWSFVRLVPAPPDAGSDAGPGALPDAGQDAGDGGADAGPDAGDAGPALVEETVPAIGAVTLGGEVIALDARDGSELWRWSSGGTITAPLSVGRHGVYGVYDDGSTGVVVGFDKEGPGDGGPRFETAMDKPSGGSSIAVSIGQLYPGKADQIVTVDEDAKLYHVDGSSGARVNGFDVTFSGGAQQYSHDIDTRTHDATATCDRCAPTLGTGMYGSVTNFSPPAILVPLLERVWFWSIQYNCAPAPFDLNAGEQVLGQVAFAGQHAPDNHPGNNEPVLLSTNQGRLLHVRASDIETCSPTVEVKTVLGFGETITTPPIVIQLPPGELVAAGDADGLLHLYIPRVANNPQVFLDNTGWPVDLAAPLRVAPAAGVSGGLYMPDENGTLHAVSVTGTVRWTRVFGGAPAGSALVQDDAVFVAGQDGVVHAFERGEAEPFEQWWSRQGGGNHGRAMTTQCSHTAGAEGAPMWGLISLLALAFVRRRRARRSRA